MQWRSPPTPTPTHTPPHPPHPPPPTPHLWVSIHRGRRLLLRDSCHGPLSPSPLPPARLSTSLPLTITCCPSKPGDLSMEAEISAYQEGLQEQRIKALTLQLCSYSQQRNRKIISGNANTQKRLDKHKPWSVPEAKKNKRKSSDLRSSYLLQRKSKERKMSQCTHLVWLTDDIWEVPCN